VTRAPVWACILRLGLVAGVLTAGPTASEPYRNLAIAGAGFLGPGRDTPAPDTLTTIRLGVAGPANTAAGRQLLQGVTLAAAEANARGGYHDLPYEVISRPDDGPWGVVAKQIVRLACEDEAWVIIGSLDGARAHAAELVAAKLWVPVLATAADHTIDYANVPWVFRVLPDDLSQARALLRTAAEAGWKRLVLISEGWRDAHLGAAQLLRDASGWGLEVVLHLEYDPYAPTDGVRRVLENPADAIVIWGRPFAAVPLMAALRRAKVEAPFLLPAVLAVQEVAQLGEGGGEVLVASPCDLSARSPEMTSFILRWRQQTGSEPSCVGAIAYDAARLAIAAIERVGLNRARIRDELAASDFMGLNGGFSFNSLGGRVHQPVMQTLRDGRWQQR